MTVISSMDGNGVPSGVGMSYMSSFAHVDSYWRFKMSALSFGSAWTRPFSLRGAMPLLSLRSDLIKLKSLGWCSWSGYPTSTMFSIYFQKDCLSAFCSLALVSLYCRMSLAAAAPPLVHQSMLLYYCRVCHPSESCQIGKPFL